MRNILEIHIKVPLLRIQPNPKFGHTTTCSKADVWPHERSNIPTGALIDCSNALNYNPGRETALSQSRQNNSEPAKLEEIDCWATTAAH